MGIHLEKERVVHFMEQTSAALLVALLAGLSSVLGAFAIYLKTSHTNQIITASLGFASGLMITVATAELIPESIELLEGLFTGADMAALVSILCILLGVGCGIGIHRVLPHQDSHDHHHEANHDHCPEHIPCTGDIYHVGLVSMIGLALHNLPEGAALYLTAADNLALGISMAVAIAMHSIPQGISIAMPVYVSSGSRLKAFGYTFLGGITMPLGALIAWAVLGPFMSSGIFGFVYAFVAGIMLYIAFQELLPASRQYGHHRLALYSIIAGVCIFPLAHVFHG